MGKKEIIEILRRYKKECAGQYGILDIGVLGSVARDEAGEASDVDVVVFSAATYPSFLTNPSPPL